MCLHQKNVNKHWKPKQTINFSVLKYWLHRKILGESRDFVSGEHEIRRGGTISTIFGNDVKFQEFLGTEILATS